MTRAEATVFVIMSALTIINVMVLGLTLKLYTEILKDSAQNRRSQQ